MGCNCGKKFSQSSGNTVNSLKTVQQSSPKIINSAPVPSGMTLTKPVVRGRV